MLRDYVYSEIPITGGKRAFTPRLVLLEIDRKKNVKKELEEEQKEEFPALYMLVDDTNKKVYVGQTREASKRLDRHKADPPDEIEDWGRAVIVWDGRPRKTSIFSLTSLREKLEYELISIFDRGEDFDSANTIRSEPAEMEVYQRAKADAILPELLFMIRKFGLISHQIVENIEEKKQLQKEVPIEDLISTLKKDHQVSGVDRSLQIFCLDKEKVFYRPGSEKPRGWQVTIRGSFKEFVENTDKHGYIIINRGYGYKIPVERIREVYAEQMKGQDTLDIYIEIDVERTKIVAPEPGLDITEYKIK